MEQKTTQPNCYVMVNSRFIYLIIPNLLYNSKISTSHCVLLIVCVTNIGIVTDEDLQILQNHIVALDKQEAKGSEALV